MRNSAIEEMEKKLIIWIEDHAQKHMLINIQVIIMDRKNLIFLHIILEFKDDIKLNFFFFTSQ